MQKAMFLIESWKRGILTEIDSGYILTVNSPDIKDIQHKLDPYRIEMVSYQGLRSIQEVDDGLKFNTTGKKVFSLIEPVNYPNKHQDPAFRSTRTTEYIPFRIRECETFLTTDNKFRILVPQRPVDIVDSFTIEYPKKGDLCVIYFIFHNDVEGVVLPYISDNLQLIIKRLVSIPTIDAKRIAKSFTEIIHKLLV